MQMSLHPASADVSALAVHRLPRPEGRIAYRVVGDGPLVVCVPGMGEIAACYRFTVPPLRDAGFRVAVMDLRGHGESDATFSRYDDVAAGTDILALVERLGGSAIVVGTSMGAGAAVWASAQQPAAVRGLVLIGPFVRNAPVGRLAAALFRTLMMPPWARAAWLAYLPQLYPARKPTDFAEHRARIRTAMRRPGATRAFIRTTRTDHTAAAESLPRVASPALVVMGTADPDFADPRAEAEWVSAQLHAQTLLVEGAGHYPQTEEPDLVNPPLVAFCRTVADA